MTKSHQFLTERSTRNKFVVPPSGGVLRMSRLKAELRTQSAPLICLSTILIVVAAGWMTALSTERCLAQSPSKSAASDKKSDAKLSGHVLKTEFGNLEIFPPDNPWNQDISKLSVHERTRAWIDSIGADKPLFPCFGADYQGAPNGIAYVVVDGKHPKQYVDFEYPEESDSGPYPIPKNPLIEGGANAPIDSDRHLLMIDYHNKRLYELFHVLPNGPGKWKAGSGAVFELTSNKTRPLGWTSADAAGLPIFPGLVRYDETVELGEIRHALRFTVRRSQKAYILPATHFASNSQDQNLPPMGLRVRLKADYDISRFPKSAQVILTALKKYGMFLADNGSDWFVTGTPDNRWKDDDLHTLKRIKGHDLECVDTGPLRFE